MLEGRAPGEGFEWWRQMKTIVRMHVCVGVCWCVPARTRLLVVVGAVVWYCVDEHTLVAAQDTTREKRGERRET